jgi:hypothetical protein
MAGALAWTMSADFVQAETNHLWTKAAQEAVADANHVEPEQVKITDWTIVPNDTTALVEEARAAYTQKQADLEAKRQELTQAQLNLQSVQNELASIEQAVLSQESKALLNETYSKRLEEAQKAVETLQSDIAKLEEELSQPFEAPQYPQEIAYAVASIQYPSFTINKLVFVDAANGKVIPEAEANTYPAVKEVTSQVKDPNGGWKDSTINNPMAVTYLVVFLLAVYLLLFRTERHSKQAQAALRNRGGVHSQTFSA